MFKFVYLVILANYLAPCLTREVMVVIGTEEEGVLEIYDFLTKSWRAIEKLPSEGKYRSDDESDDVRRRPGTARLVEDHSVLQYELRNGLSQELASYPKSIEGASTLEYGDTFCLVGGYNVATRSLRSAVLCWNPLTPRLEVNLTDSDDLPLTSGGWVALPDMTVARHQPGAVVMDGKLYVVGGYDTDKHEFLANAEVFDDVTQQWYAIAPLRHARAGMQLVALNGKLYAIGGWKQRQFLNIVERYDPLTNEWEDVSPMNQPRAKFGSVVRDGSIFVVGGRKGFRIHDELKAMEVYSPDNDQWDEMLPPMTILSGPTRATIVKDAN